MSGKRPVLAALSLPEDAAGGLARLTVLCSREILAENCRAIAEVSESRVRLAVRDGLISVSGTRLALADVRPDSLRIVGEIAAIELPGGSAHD